MGCVCNLLGGGAHHPAAPVDTVPDVYYDEYITSRPKREPRRRQFEPPDIGEPLDHFVSGFEWSIPTRIGLVDFDFLEMPAGELERMLCYSVAQPLRRVYAGPGLLEDFLKLEVASDVAILAYARRWGPLWLCPVHSLPWRHDPDCQASVSDWQRDEDEVELTDEELDRLRPEDLPEDISQTWYDELLSGWRDLSRQARATIRLARRLHDGKLGDQADWDALPFLQQLLVRPVVPRQGDPFATLEDFPDTTELGQVEGGGAETDVTVHSVDDSSDSSDDLDPDPDEPYRRRLAALGRRRMANSIEFQRQLLGEVLNYWLELAGVRPRLDWRSAKPAVQLGGYGLIGALAVQLLFDCSRTDGLAVCTSCGTPFLPGPRRPRRDRNIYCSDCGIKAASRDAATRYRQTKKYRATYDSWLQKRRGSSI
jgi:DNA-directed RNA polymerase subunit RPC12/RpoP